MRRNPRRRSIGVVLGMAGEARRTEIRLVVLIATTLLIAACTGGQTTIPGGSAPPTTATDSPTAAPSSPQASAADASAPITGLTGHIVFSRAGGSYGEDTIFIANPDGTDEKPLSETDRGSAPFAGPDGSVIAYGTYGPETNNRGTAAITDVSGSKRTILPLPSGTINLGSGPVSPDGKRMLREGWDDAHQDAAGVYVSNLDGSGVSRLIDHHFIPADWSPDGAHLLLFDGAAGEPPPPGQLYVANADGTEVKQLTPASTLVLCCGNYRYSPDGSKILFATADGDLWTIEPDGSNLARIFANPGDQWAIAPTWSPDGSMIMFAIDPVANPFAHPPNALFVIRSDGSGLTRVLGGNDFKRELVWLPA
jgi:hypothetical protein